MRSLGWDLRPRRPAPALIKYRLWRVGTYPVLVDSDGVGFETLRYYLNINTIKDLYCAVLRETATTCDYAVTNCHRLCVPWAILHPLELLENPFLASSVKQLLPAHNSNQSRLVVDCLLPTGRLTKY